MGLSQGGFFILQFGGSVILARLLSPYEMGVFAVGAAITGVLSAIQAFGLAGFIVREQDLSPELLASTFTVNAGVAVLLSASVAAVSTLGGRFLHEAGVRHVMLVLALLPLLGAFEFVPSASLERRGRFKSIALVGLGRMLSATFTTVGLAFAGFSYMSIAYGNLTGALVSLVGFNVAGRQHSSLRLSVAEWRRITRFGLQMVAISGVNAIFGRAAELAMGRLGG
jgi:O-antigen/teichoic acid export membrane protein